MGKPRSKRSLVPLRQEGREETEPTRGIKPLPLTLIGSMQSEAPASRGDGGQDTREDICEVQGEVSQVNITVSF